MAAPAMTSPSTSRRHLSKFEKTAENAVSDTIFVKFLQNCLSEDDKNVTLSLETVIPTNLPGVTSLAASSWLPNAIKYCTKVRKMGAAGKEFNNYAIV